MQSKNLDVNALQTVFVEGLFSKFAVEFKRCQPPAVVPYECAKSSSSYGEPVPKAFRESLGSDPGSLNATMVVDSHVGHGSRGCVHSVSVKSGIDKSVIVPDLVIKVTTGQFCDNLRKEAAYYDELQTLQGSVIPVCYGLFTGTLPDGYSFSLGDKQCPREWVDRDAMEEDYRLHDETTFPQRRRISMLVLERLGPCMTKRSFVETFSTREQALDEFALILGQMNELGVAHHDLRKENILHAKNPPGPERCFRWRFVDLESCLKTNLRMDQLKGGQMLDFYAVTEDCLT